MKCFCDVLIKLNIEIMLNSKLCIALLTSSAYPFLEIVANLRVYNITNVGPGHLPNLPEDRKRINYLLMTESEFEDEIKL
jgi:hypothetical protein